MQVVEQAFPTANPLRVVGLPLRSFLPAPIVKMFRRAFGVSRWRSRPTALEWANALDDLHGTHLERHGDEVRVVEKSLAGSRVVDRIPAADIKSVRSDACTVCSTVRNFLSDNQKQ